MFELLILSKNYGMHFSIIRLEKCSSEDSWYEKLVSNPRTMQSNNSNLVYANVMGLTTFSMLRV